MQVGATANLSRSHALFAHWVVVASRQRCESVLLLLPLLHSSGAAHHHALALSVAILKTKKMKKAKTAQMKMWT